MTMKRKPETGNDRPDVHFAKGYSFYKLALIFVAGCLLGTWYEEIFHLISKGYYENRSGVIYGPFNPIYGVGFLLMLFVLKPFNRWYTAILAGAIAGGVFEYAANFGQEYFTGAVSWSYHNRFLNINGRTTLPYALFWGALGYFMVKIVYPFLSYHIERLPERSGKVFTWALVVFLFLNMAVSYGALIRAHARNEGAEARTPIGELFDRYYCDERLREAFPDARPVNGIVEEDAP